MIRFRSLIFSVVILCLAAVTAGAQNTGRLTFDRPESWAMKYFVSATMFSGLQPPITPPEGHKIGSVTVGLESGWIQELSPDQTRVGFLGRGPEDLNKAPLVIRPVVKVGLPWKVTAIAAAPPPFKMFGVTPHLLALGLERPIVEREQWRIGARLSGQVGSVKGGFTCPESVLAFAPGTPGNASNCAAESSDKAHLRYIGTEIQFAHRMPRMPKLTPHAALGFNWMHGEFEVNAPLVTRVAHSDLWTHGIIYTGTVGASYAITRKVAFTMDAFYAPLSVRRTATAERTNDGFFNLRAMISYDFR